MGKITGTTLAQAADAATGTSGEVKESKGWSVQPGLMLEGGPFAISLDGSRGLDKDHYYHNPTTVRLGLNLKIPVGSPFTFPVIGGEARTFLKFTPFLGGTGFSNGFTRPDGKEGNSKMSWTPLGGGLGAGAGFEWKHWHAEAGVAFFLQALTSPSGEPRPYNRPPADKCKELLDPISCQTREIADTSKGAYSSQTLAAVDPRGGNIFTFAPFVGAAYRGPIGEKGWSFDVGLRAYFPYHSANPKAGGGGSWWAIEPTFFLGINMGGGGQRQVETPAPTPAPAPAPVPAPAPAPVPALVPPVATPPSPVAVFADPVTAGASSFTIRVNSEVAGNISVKIDGKAISKLDPDQVQPKPGQSIKVTPGEELTPGEHTLSWIVTQAGGSKTEGTLPIKVTPSTKAEFKEVVLTPRAAVYLNDALNAAVVLKKPAPKSTDVTIMVVERRGTKDVVRAEIATQIQKDETEVRDVSIWKAGEAADKVGTGQRTIKVKIGEEAPIAGPIFTVWGKTK